MPISVPSVLFGICSSFEVVPSPMRLILPLPLFTESKFMILGFNLTLCFVARKTRGGLQGVIGGHTRTTWGYGYEARGGMVWVCRRVAYVVRSSAYVLRGVKYQVSRLVQRVPTGVHRFGGGGWLGFLYREVAFAKFYIVYQHAGELVVSIFYIVFMVDC